MNALTCSILHALDRRVRLRAPALIGHRAASEDIATQLAREPGCEVVTINPRTGSLLVGSNDAKLDPAALCRRVEALLAAATDDEGHSLTEARPDHPGPTRVARVVAHAFAGINADVRDALDGRADLGTLLPVVFAFAGIAEVFVTRKLPAPAWFNLLWWSQRSFMTFNTGAVEEESRGAREGNGQTHRGEGASPAAQPEGRSAP